MNAIDSLDAKVRERCLRPLLGSVLIALKVRYDDVVVNSVCYIY